MNEWMKVAAAAPAEPVFSWYTVFTINKTICHFKISGFLDMMACTEEYTYQCFGVPCCPKLMFQFLDISRLEAQSFSKTLVPILQSTPCHHITPENLIIHLHQLQILHSLSFLASKHLSNCMSYELIISYLSNVWLLVVKIIKRAQKNRDGGEH
jgi:hypothetical protein